MNDFGELRGGLRRPKASQKTMNGIQGPRGARDHWSINKKLYQLQYSTSRERRKRQRIFWFERLAFSPDWVFHSFIFRKGNFLSSTNLYFKTGSSQTFGVPGPESRKGKVSSFLLAVMVVSDSIPSTTNHLTTHGNRVQSAPSTNSLPCNPIPSSTTTTTTKNPIPISSKSTSQKEHRSAPPPPSLIKDKKAGTEYICGDLLGEVN